MHNDLMERSASMNFYWLEKMVWKAPLDYDFSVWSHRKLYEWNQVLRIMELCREYNL
jgi:hypothetical protein